MLIRQTNAVYVTRRCSDCSWVYTVSRCRGECIAYVIRLHFRYSLFEHYRDCVAWAVSDGEPAAVSTWLPSSCIPASSTTAVVVVPTQFYVWCQSTVHTESTSTVTLSHHCWCRQEPGSISGRRRLTYGSKPATTACCDDRYILYTAYYIYFPFIKRNTLSSLRLLLVFLCKLSSWQ